jgi:hypothetical protein
LFARFQALLMRFVKHRWWSDLDCSQLVPSFLSQTVAHVAHWLTFRHQADDETTPLFWITPVLQNLWPLRL